MANMALKKVSMPEQDPKVRARNFEEQALRFRLSCWCKNS